MYFLTKPTEIVRQILLQCTMGKWAEFVKVETVGALFICDVFVPLCIGVYVSKAVSHSSEYCATHCPVVSSLWPLRSKHHKTSPGLPCWCHSGNRRFLLAIRE